jgi:hypothetical protein
LCLLAIFRPVKLVEEEEKDEEEQKKFSQPPPPQEQRAFVIRRAFWSSLFLMIASAAIGYIVGQVINGLLCSVPKTVIISFQIIGAMLLLWGTLFVRGWEIQSYSGVALSERVNKWIYRALYCIGTTIIICSLVLSSSGQTEAARLPEGVIVHRDIPYVTDGHERQKLDLYLPKAKKKQPLIIWVHGGAWLEGSKENSVPAGYRLCGGVVNKKSVFWEEG